MISTVVQENILCVCISVFVCVYICVYVYLEGGGFSVKFHLNSYLPILRLKVLLGPYILQFRMFNIFTLFSVYLTKNFIKLFDSKS